MRKMKNFHFGIIIIQILLLTVINSGDSTSVPNKDELFTINITMTNIMTTQQDQYAFVRYKLPDEELMIVGYSPLTNMNVAHHMLTYACENPGSQLPFWLNGSPCSGESMIIHGWARNAPALTLPEDVGIAVGLNTPYKYIVVNIHYLAIVMGDNSGNQLIVSRKPRKYRAGIMLGYPGQITLPPKTQTIRTPFSCHYNGPPITIFAVRVHTHQWGRVNSLYRIRGGNISQVVKSNPQWPQSFYPLPSPVKIQSGDDFVGQCVYDNKDDRVIYAGSTHNDEMCNVYSMYSYEPAKTSNSVPPFLWCSDGSANNMISLIPPDSVIAPDKPSDISGTNNDDAEHTMKLSTGFLYTNVENWPDVKSLPSQLGQIGGIALSNGNDQLVVFHRGSRKWEFQYFDGYRFRNEVYGPIEEDVLIHVDTQTGQVKSRWGAKMFYMPHGLTIDHQGNFWLTDIAMHQVFMFKSNNLTHPALTVGEKFQSGSGKNQFCRPADIAVMKNGDFFVADGYCNSRIMKFNNKGEHIMQWGFPMTERRDSDGFPLPYEWNIVHSIALNEDEQLLCGADRENFRIQCFHPDAGNFLRQIRVEKKETNGAIYAIAFAPNANGAFLFAVTGGPQTSNKKVYMIDAQTGDILTSFDANSHLLSPHDITVSTNADEIYIGELASSPADALHKFKLSKNKSLPLRPFYKRFSLNDKRIRLALIILAGLAIPLLVILIVYCMIRIRNLRMKSKLDLWNTSIRDVNNGRTNGGSVFSHWINRPTGFERLEQVIEEEDQLLDSDEENQPANAIARGDTITIKSKQQTTKFNNKNNTFKLKMGDSL